LQLLSRELDLLGRPSRKLHNSTVVGILSNHRITGVVTAPRAPWQNAYVERLIGSIRRECLDHAVVVNERHLRRVLFWYVDYYSCSRTHLSLDKDCPDTRPVRPPSSGKVTGIPQVGGLHHRYERLAA
jgi:putative transposase